MYTRSVEQSWETGTVLEDEMAVVRVDVVQARFASSHQCQASTTTLQVGGRVTRLVGKEGRAYLSPNKLWFSQKVPGYSHPSD